MTALQTCGVGIDPLTMDDAVSHIRSAARRGAALPVHLINAYTLSLAVQDERFAALLDAGGLRLADGMPLVWLARWRGLEQLSDRVYGPELTLAVCDRGRQDGLRHYLYGGSPEVVERFARTLRDRFPGIEIVGVESPPYRPLGAEEEQELVRRIRDSGADLVWVGLGTPKQDRFVNDFAARFGVPTIAVGAAFDFIAGAKRMAPRWMQRAGLEWLFRLLSEPRRLWKRYLVGNTVFLWGALRTTQITPGQRSR